MTPTPPAYLVTGGTGFLGRHVLEQVRAAEPHARLLVLVRSRDAWERQPWRKQVGEVEVVVGSLVDTDGWSADPRLEGIAGIFHLAAEVKHSRADVAGMERTNVEGTLSMVRLAAKLRCRLLFASTSGTVSCMPQPGPGADEDAAHCEHIVGDWPYYASKIRAERRASELARELGVRTIVFRPPVLLGPRDHRYRSTGHLLRLLRGRLPFILDGTIHYTDVRDAAAAMVAAMRHPDPKPVYHLVGTVCTVDEFFRMAARLARLNAGWRVVPAGLLHFLARVNAATGSRVHFVPDPVVIELARHHWPLRSRHAEADLGYRARPPEETLADTIEWMRANHPDLRPRPGVRVATK